MSACGGKADVEGCCEERPLMTQSGHGTKRLTLDADQVPVLKKNLAQIILASACNGKRDVEQLKEIALRGVSGRSHVSL